MNFAIIPASWAPYLQAILRIVVGLLFLEHGTGKLLSFPVAARPRPDVPHGLLLFTGFDGADRRRADRRRLPDPPGRLCSLRLHGRGLFHGPFPDGLFPRR